MKRLERWCSVGTGASLVGLALEFLIPTTAFGASPSPGRQGGDLRSSGSGPGFAGDPLFAIAVVLAIGLGTLVVTLMYVRLTRRPAAR